MTTAQEDIDAAQREELKDEQTSLPGVITKMKLIGAQQYEGKMFDNIYSIFNQLLVSEKRLLLKGVINMLFIIEDKTINGSLVNQPYAHVIAITKVQEAVAQVEVHMSENISNLEDFNRREMIKLRSRITMVGFVMVFSTIIGVFIASMYLSNTKSDTLGTFSQFGKIVFEVLGIN